MNALTHTANHDNDGNQEESGMTLIADGHEGLDGELLGSLAGRAARGSLEEGDLRDSLRLFCMVCNRVDELRFELRDLTQSYQFEIGDRRGGAVFTRGACSVYEGRMDSPDVTLCMDAAIVLDLLTCRANSAAAHMNGDIKYRGTKNGALRLQTAFELFLDVLDAHAGQDRPDSE